MVTKPERIYPGEMPVLALRQTVVFPLTLQPLAGDRLIFLTLQTIDKDEPEILRTGFETAASCYTRRFYGASWTDQGGVSVIWAHRWW